MAKNKPLRIAFDSCCLIGLINGEEEFKPLLSYLEAIDKGEVVCVLPAMVLAEVLPDHDSASSARIRDLLESDKVEWVDITPAAARKAASLRIVYGLKGEDACIIAGALVGKCDILFSTDGGFPYGRIEELEISKPKPFGEPNLFSPQIGD